jgi:hypothetical protein
MEQHHLPLPHRLARDQRRAIGQRGNGAVGQVGVGLGQHLRVTVTSGGTGRPKKGELSAKGASAFGSPQLIAPPTVRPPSRRRTGISGVFLGTADIAGRQARPGKAQQKPARRRASPSAHPSPTVSRATSASTITSGLASSTSSSVPSIRSATGSSACSQVMGGRQQLQPLAVVPARDQRHLAPLQAVIRQADRPGDRTPAISNRVMRLRNSGGSDRRTSASASPGAKARGTRASSRSTPTGRGHGPKPRSRRRLAAGRAQGAQLRTAPSSKPGGAGPRWGGGFRTRSRPRACSSAASRSARPGWSSPSDSQKVSNPPRAAPGGPARQIGGGPGAGVSGQPPGPGVRGLKLGHLRRRSVSAPRATGRPARPASSTSASARSIRRGQSRASAQPPSIRISSGPVPGCRVPAGSAPARQRR